MPALIVNFDDVLFRNGGAAPRPDAIRLIKDGAAAGWRIALTSALTQGEVRRRLEPFLPELAAQALVAGSDFVNMQTTNLIDFAVGKLRTNPQETLALERGDAGFWRANAAEVPNIIISHEMPPSSDLQHTRLVVDRLGLPDDRYPITVLIDTGGINPHPLVQLSHLEACLEPFRRRMNEFGIIRGGRA